MKLRRHPDDVFVVKVKWRLNERTIILALHRAMNFMLPLFVFMFALIMNTGEKLRT